MYFKKIQDFIIEQIYCRLEKDVLSIALSLLTGSGVWRMSNSFTGGILLGISLGLFIWLIKTWINEVKLILNEQNSVKDKVFILSIEPHTVSNGQVKAKYWIGFNIYFANCSSQIIKITFDPVKTKVTVNNHIDPETKYPEKLLIPYEYGVHNAVRTYYTEYDKVYDDNNEVKVHIDIAFKYAINNSDSNEYDVLYTYKAECMINRTKVGEPYIRCTHQDLILH